MLSFFPRCVLDEILNLIESVSKGFPSYSRFIANSSSCTTTELSKLLTFCLTTIKNNVIEYCENLFWSIKNSCEVLNKLKSRGFRASSLSAYDFST